MPTLRRVAFLAALLVAPSVAFADLVGKDAPGFTVPETVNEAPALDLQEMKGEVILIKYWGTR